MTPYAHPAYVAALAAEAGSGHAALPVAAWDGAAVLLRLIPGTPYLDAAGPYPLLPVAPHWNLAAGLAEIAAAGAISLVLVADPLSPPADLSPFHHRLAYKRHHLVLGDYAPDPHHRRRIRRFAARGELREVAPASALDDWLRLYAVLAARRGFRGGTHDFGRAVIESLIPLGLRAFAASEAGATVAMGLWLRHGDTAWYHLGASDDPGREGGASHAVMDLAIRTLRAEGVTRIVLGGGLSPLGAPPCGLDRFKAGFADAAQPNWLLGAVLDKAACAKLGGALGSYFPAYRAIRTAA